MRKFLKLFKRKADNGSANIANERLQIIVSHRKTANNNSEKNYLLDMKQELIEVIAKYVKVDDNKVNVNLEKAANNDVLEINIELPQSWNI